MKELIQYREMIVSLVQQDLRSRYKGSVLGFLWTFLNPLFQLVVYTLVFSVIMRAGIEDYYLFMFVAFVPWLFFSSCINGGARAILDKKDLIKKIYFPRLVLPISYVTSNFINMILSFVVVFGAIAISGKGINGIALLFLPLVMIIEYLMALGITVLLSGLTVYFRDLEYIFGIVTMAWMYITPVLYSADMVPEKYKFIFHINPMTSIIVSYRQILYYKEIPVVSDLIISFIEALVILVIGWLVFNKVEKKFVEEL